MRPMLKYRGGKSREIPNIERHIPAFKGRYIEPFFGGGALFFHLEPEHAIINDINGKLMDFYLDVRNNYEQTRRDLDALEVVYSKNRREFDRLKAATPESRVEDRNEDLYYSIRDMFNGKARKEYTDGAIYYFINKTAYSGMIRYNSNGEFNVPFGRYKNLNTEFVTERHSELLRHTKIFNADYQAVLIWQPLRISYFLIRRMIVCFRITAMRSIVMGLTIKVIWHWRKLSGVFLVPLYW